MQYGLSIYAEGGPDDTGVPLYSGPVAASAPLSIGRAQDNQVRLSSPSVGLFHAVVRAQDNELIFEGLGQPVFEASSGAQLPRNVSLFGDGAGVRTLDLGFSLQGGPQADDPSHHSRGAVRLLFRQVSSTQAPARPSWRGRAGGRKLRWMDRGIVLLCFAITLGSGFLGVRAVTGAIQYNSNMLQDIDRVQDAHFETSRQSYQKLEEAHTKLDRIESLNRQTVKAVSKLERSTQRGFRRFSQALKKAPSVAEDNSRAVWYAGYQPEDTPRKDEFVGVGTAWAYDHDDKPRTPPVLITNAHVVAVLDRALDEDDRQVVLRREGRKAAVEIKLARPSTESDVTPAYHKFKEWMKDYPKLILVNPFDLGVLRLAPDQDPKALGRGLRISRAEAGKVKVGNRVGYMGYPFENLSQARPQAQNPSPAFVGGVVARITDFIGVSARPSTNRLLLVDATILGGASGSPLFDERGRVIGIMFGGDVLALDKEEGQSAVTSGNTLQAEDLFRVPLGFAYAARADLIKELLPAQRTPRFGEVRDRQERRWRDTITRYSDQANLLRELLDMARAQSNCRGRWTKTLDASYRLPRTAGLPFRKVFKQPKAKYVAAILPAGSGLMGLGVQKASGGRDQVATDLTPGNGPATVRYEVRARRENQAFVVVGSPEQEFELVIEQCKP